MRHPCGRHQRARRGPPGLSVVRTAAVGVIQSALAAVEAERQYINDLNVYPVPDGDTGTNMALTVRAVVEELEQSDVNDIPSVAAAVTKGSLMGARGNSGVILSQIVRGICDVWGQANSLDTAVFKRAVQEGQQAAYRAVKVPVEGTMLTVIREMATAAQAVPDGLGLEHLLAAVEEAGRVAVENTTAQLPALQKAGVVDAGGYGLLVLFRGLAVGIEELMRGGKIAAGARLVARAAGEAVKARVHAERRVVDRGAQRALRVPLLHELPAHGRGHPARAVRGVPPAARRQRSGGGRRADGQGPRARQRPRRGAQRGRQIRGASATSRSTTCTRRHATATSASPRRRPCRRSARAAVSSWRSSPAPATSSCSASSAATPSSTAASP